MSRKTAAETLAPRNRYGSSSLKQHPVTKRKPFLSVLSQATSATKGAQSRTAPRFLSECEAATYLGMSIAELRDLRIMDLAMIGQGFKPYGPPALWSGRRFCYARESLDEWVRIRSATHFRQRLDGLQSRTSRGTI